MRAAGTVTGLLVLGTFVIPGAYLPNAETYARVSGRRTDDAADRGAANRGSASLAGRVYGPDGKPLPGVDVSLAGSGFWPPRTVLSDREGRFRWGQVPAGVYELRASRGQLASLPLEGILLDPGAQRVFGLRLLEGWTLTGEVHDGQTGTSIADAEVHVAEGLLGAYSRDARSDAAGRFEVRGVVGDNSAVYVEAPGYVAVGPLLASSHNPAIEVRMERGASLRGVVVDDGGRPIAGARVRAFGSATAVLGTNEANDSLGVTAGPVPPISSSGTRQATLADAVVTDRSGAFALEGLRAGTYTAVATHQGYAPGESEEVTVRPGRAEDGVRLVLFVGGEVRGRVLDARDRGLAGIPVELRTPAERLPRMAISADDGSFAFLGVRGDIEIAAVPYDMQPVSLSLSVERKARLDIDLVLDEELLTLRGRVVDERGVGVPDALVTATATRAGTTFRRNAKTDDDGSFAVPALPEPPYAVQVEHAEYSHAAINVTDNRDEIRVQLVGGTTVLGQVIDDWTSSGLEGATVALEGPSSLSARTDGDGRFAFRQVPAAVYEIRTSHPDFESQRRRIEVERPLYVDRPQELQAVRLLPGGTIEGEVLDAYGEPVLGAEVTWQPEGWDGSVGSDRHGRFVLRGVPAGSIWVRARHPDAGESAASRPTTVRPQETSPGVYVRLPGRLGAEE